jgi:hypothetical protein
MVDGAFPHHAANRSLQYLFLLIFYSYLSYQRRIRRISFVTFVESNAKALLSAAANKNATCKQVLRPAGGLSFPPVTPLSLPPHRSFSTPFHPFCVTVVTMVTIFSISPRYQKYRHDRHISSRLLFQKL